MRFNRFVYLYFLFQVYELINIVVYCHASDTLSWFTNGSNRANFISL